MHCIEGLCPFERDFPVDCPGECCYVRQFMREFLSEKVTNERPPEDMVAGSPGAQ